MQTFFLPKFTIDKKISTKNKLTFTAAPLIQGFAVTLGNSLRRVMLSSLVGTTIFAIRIKGVAQEFQNISGVEETVLEIGLNIQKILLSTVPSTIKEGETVNFFLKISGAKTVTAKDINLPAELELVNPEQKILTIVDSTKIIEIEFWAHRSRGFSNFEESKELIKQLNTNSVAIIALTANFSPVLNVALKTEEIKVGERAVIEKLTMMIETNGTETPENSLMNATKIFQAHLEFFGNLSTHAVSTDDFKFVKKETTTKMESGITVAQLDFSKRTDNALQLVGINKLSELQNWKLSDLSRIKNLGAKSVSEITEKLKKEYNFEFKI